MDAVKLEKLSQQARSGDTLAANEVVSALLPYWTRASTGIASARIEPQDLVQDAVLQLLSAWRKGEGPASNTRAYVTTIMRNQVISQARSPKSRTLPVPDDFFELFAGQDSAIDEVDSREDGHRIRMALATLATDHQEVLRAVIADDKKPRDLVGKFGRPTPAISSLLARAKRAMHRALLIEYLKEGGEACASNALLLPSKVANHFGQQVSSARGMEHIGRCDRCRHNWGRFSGSTGALGVVPILAGSHASTPPSPASVSASLLKRQRDHAIASTSGPPKTAKALSRSSSMHRTFILLSAATVSLSMVAVSMNSTAILPRGSSKKPEGEVPSISMAPAEGDEPVRFEADRILTEAGALHQVKLSFSIPPETRGSLQSLKLSLPREATPASVNNSLSCGFDQPSPLLCTGSSTTDLNKEIILSVEHAPPHGEFSVELHLIAGERHYRGQVKGNW